MFFSWWIDKHIIVQPRNQILVSNKKEQSTGPCNNMNFKCILLNERSQTLKVTYHMVTITWHSGKCKRGRKQISGFQKLEVRCVGIYHKGVQGHLCREGVMKLFCLLVVMVTLLCVFNKINRPYTKNSKFYLRKNIYKRLGGRQTEKIVPDIK